MKNAGGPPALPGIAESVHENADAGGAGKEFFGGETVAGVERRAQAVFGRAAVGKDESNTAGGAEVGQSAGAFGDAKEQRGNGGVPIASEGEFEIGRGEEDNVGLLRSDEGGGGAPVFLAETEIVAEGAGGSGVVGGEGER